jgi:hypothetical protein
LGGAFWNGGDASVIEPSTIGRSLHRLRLELGNFASDPELFKLNSEPGWDLRLSLK